MGSSQESALSTNVAKFVDESSEDREVSYIDSLPVYVKELIARGAADAFAKTAVSPLDRIKILLQVSGRCRKDDGTSISLLMSIINRLSVSWKLVDGTIPTN